MSFEPPERTPGEDTPQGPSASHGKAPQRLLAALRRVLRPLVRMLLQHGISFRQATNLLKQVYIEIAAEEIERGGGKVSASRLSLVTGIQRKAAKHLYENPPDPVSAPRSVALGAQLVARWMQEPAFLGADGRPLALARRRGESGEPGFDDLVRSVSSDIHPRSVLDEWLRMGVVRVVGDERVELVTAAFVPRRGFEEKAFYFGRNLHDHLDVAARNLGERERPLLERSVHYSALSSGAIDELAQLAESEGMRLLETVNRRARELQRDADARERTPTRSLGRMNFGMYFYRDPEGTPSSPSERSDGADAAGEKEPRGPEDGR